LRARASCPLFDGSIKAVRIGSFVRHGFQFEVIRPGYDWQGRRRTAWTQIAHEGVPIFDIKTHMEAGNAIALFDQEWTKSIGRNKKLAKNALKRCKAMRMRCFRDGVTGESPAPSISHDGRGHGATYIS
jgi:hypothetical protein